MPAVGGSMTDGAAFDWETLDNDTSGTTFTTHLNKPTFIELDLGAGGQMVDRVNIVHPKGTMVASQNNVLCVMNTERLIMLQYVCPLPSTQTENFAIEAAEPIADEGKVKTIRYLQMIRVGTGYIHLHSMDAFLGTHTRACLNDMACACFRRYRATDGTIYPPASGAHWADLNAGLDNTSVSSCTVSTGGAYMQLDFGVNGVRVNRVQVGHAVGAWVLPIRHTAGLVFVAIDPAGKQIFSYPFGDIGTNGGPVYNFNMDGQLV